MLSKKFDESKIFFDVGVGAKDYYRIKDRKKSKRDKEEYTFSC